VAQALERVAPEHGALDFETIEVETCSTATRCATCGRRRTNRAKALIENLMIAANGVTARFLDARGFPSLRRVVKSPERWDRIRRLAEEAGDRLPPEADSIALAALRWRGGARPIRDTFRISHAPSSSCSARANTSSNPPGAEPPGHFGLAGARLHALDRAEPPLPGSHHAAAAEGDARRPAVAVRHRRARAAWPRTARSRRTRPTRSSVRCARRRRRWVVESRIGETFAPSSTGASEQGDVGARARAADRRQAAARRPRP
jgi:exoribonuclease-2